MEKHGQLTINWTIYVKDTLPVIKPVIVRVKIWYTDPTEANKQVSN